MTSALSFFGNSVSTARVQRSGEIFVFQVMRRVTQAIGEEIKGAYIFLGFYIRSTRCFRHTTL